MRMRTPSAAALALAACLMAACHKGADKEQQEKLEARLTNIEAKIQALTWRLQGPGGTEGTEEAKGEDGAKATDGTKAADAAQTAPPADSGSPSVEQRLAAIENMLNPRSGPYASPTSIADRVEALEKK